MNFIFTQYIQSLYTFIFKPVCMHVFVYRYVYHVHFSAARRITLGIGPQVPSTFYLRQSLFLVWTLAKCTRRNGYECTPFVLDFLHGSLDRTWVCTLALPTDPSPQLYIFFIYHQPRNKSANCKLWGCFRVNSQPFLCVTRILSIQA